jgi:peptidoglycan hydrolase CwlO-like protein
MTESPRPLWNSPVAAALISAMLGAFGAFTTDRVTQSTATGSTQARIEAMDSKVRDIEATLRDTQARYVSKDEFTQFLGQISDMKSDIREIKDALRTDDRKPR